MSLTVNAIVATGIAASQAFSSTSSAVDLSSEVAGLSSASDLVAAHNAAFAGAPIVVRGARLNPDCVPPAVLNKRLDRAAAFVRLHPANRVVVTGGKTQGGCPTESQSMEAMLRARLVFNPIIRDEWSGNTVQNAQAVAGLIPDKQVVLVTSQDHLPRAMGNFASVGIETKGVAAF